ncbi:MAG TPA: N-6 DNA methylase, partial [Thermomicrobiales bacterium]|nr:N-6 DNA methylase [Thermomicrobiales bacterium]
ARYHEYFAVSRLRDLTERTGSVRTYGAEFSDLWVGLVQTFRCFTDESAAHLTGVTHLNGQLFHKDACATLEAGSISNRDLLRAIAHLNRYRDEGDAPKRGRRTRSTAVLRRVNYAALDVEELGSVYESLLDLQPHVDTGRAEFTFVKSNERKTTGSYYTPPGLVAELVKSALGPVIAERLAAVGSDRSAQEAAILAIKVCDPAAGSGHFLLAAARRLGRELARIRNDGNEPGAEGHREAVRDVIAHCIYGVDVNELAVELAKVALWLEAMDAGKPLGFLDHRIRHGNSLIGTPPGFDASTVIIPDEAFKEVTGDDKAIAKATRERNKAERRDYKQVDAGQLLLSDGSVWKIAPAYLQTMNAPEATVEDVVRKEATFRVHRWDKGWEQRKVLADLWTAAFFWPLTSDAAQAPTTAFLRVAASRNEAWQLIDPANRERVPDDPFSRTVRQALAITADIHAFHWDLEFEDVFAREDPGFDCILGNPPWERIKLQEQEFFGSRNTCIANAPNKAARDRLIRALPEGTQADRTLHADFETAKRLSERESMFLRTSGRNPLTGRGDINTYSVFAELDSALIRNRGRAGVIVPTGIATDDTNKVFFGSMVESGKLASLFDFENREGVFPAVDSRMKFSLLTL